jgi:hypothetical protein
MSYFYFQVQPIPIVKLDIALCLECNEMPRFPGRDFCAPSCEDKHKLRTTILKCKQCKSQPAVGSKFCGPSCQNTYYLVKSIEKPNPTCKNCRAYPAKYGEFCTPSCKISFDQLVRSRQVHSEPIQIRSRSIYSNPLSIPIMNPARMLSTCIGCGIAPVTNNIYDGYCSFACRNRR